MSAGTTSLAADELREVREALGMRIDYLDAMVRGVPYHVPAIPDSWDVYRHQLDLARQALEKVIA